MFLPAQDAAGNLLLRAETHPDSESGRRVPAEGECGGNVAGASDGPDRRGAAPGTDGQREDLEAGEIKVHQGVEQHTVCGEGT
jgi:hypothetical protein